MTAKVGNDPGVGNRHSAKCRHSVKNSGRACGRISDKTGTSCHQCRFDADDLLAER